MTEHRRKASVLEAVYDRRSVREYEPRRVDARAIETLIQAAVQAPSASNRQPWAFAVIQDRDLLARLSERVKAGLLKSLGGRADRFGKYRNMLADPDYNVFHDAGTLILVCARSRELGDAEDCCLSAQNLMLAAHELGLGTCPIGFARDWLNRAETKRELGIPEDHAVVLPIVVGHPRRLPPAPGREAPRVLFWKR